jgi:stringent starvation protein B
MTKENSTTTTPKQQLAEEWLRGDHIMVHLDARRDGVVVPAHLGGQPGLSLKISYLFNTQPTVDERGIYAPLRFGSEYFECSLPWGAIWGLSSEKGELRIWPDSVPVELLRGVAPGTVAEVGSPTPASPENRQEEKRARPKLTLIK